MLPMLREFAEGRKRVSYALRAARQLGGEESAMVKFLPSLR